MERVHATDASLFQIERRGGRKLVEVAADRAGLDTLGEAMSYEATRMQGSHVFNALVSVDRDITLKGFPQRTIKNDVMPARMMLEIALDNCA